MAIGQAVFQRRLQVNLDGVIPVQLVDTIINSGVTSVASLVEPSQLPEVIQRYSLAVTQTFVSRATKQCPMRFISDRV
jgi:hypothetical protein